MGREPLPGNYGLWDQVEALKWIQNNIHHFRGNPDDVTIFGNSAGASSAGILLASPVTKGTVMLLLHVYVPASAKLDHDCYIYNAIISEDDEHVEQDHIHNV